MLAIHPSSSQIRGLLLVSVHHSERSSCASFRRLSLSCYLCGMRTLLIPLVLLLMLAGCGYVGRRMWLLLPMDNAYKMVILGLLIASLLCFFFNFIVGLDRFSLPVARVFYEVGNSSIFILLYLAMLFLALDIARLMGLVPPSFLRHSVQGTLFVSVAIVGLFGYGYLHYYHKVRVPIALSSHKPLPQPSKFVMISDMHLGYHNTRNDLAKWVDLINAEHPDAVLIAGDITDFSIQPLLKADMAAEFQRPHLCLLGQSRLLCGRGKQRAILSRSGHTFAARHGRDHRKRHRTCGERRPHQHASQNPKRHYEDHRWHAIHHFARPSALSFGGSRATTHRFSIQRTHPQWPGVAHQLD